MMQLTGMDQLKAAEARNKVNALEVKLGHEKDKFKRSDIKREISWQMRRSLFFRGKRAK
jgi:hypothetical protein